MEKCMWTSQLLVSQLLWKIVGGEGVGDTVKIQNFKNEKIQRDFFVCGTQSRFWLWLTLRNIHFRWN